MRTWTRWRRRTIVIGVLAVGAALLGASPGSAATVAGVGANWQMNERLGPMLDSSGNNNNSSKIMPGITRNGSGYHFSGTGSVIVPAKASLQPGARSFTISASIHLDQPGDQNFVQKGGLSATGGQWKIEMSGTHVHCRIAGTQGAASLWAWGKYTFLHGAGFHSVTCAKTLTGVTLTVGKTVVRQAIVVGTVSTPRNVTIGGKGFGCGTDCDYMVGTMDWATLTYP
jgi:hypothetical protein